MRNSVAPIGKSIVILALIAGSSLVLAQDGKGTGEINSIWAGIKWLLEQILSENLIQKFIQGATGIASNLQGPARVLAGVLALISLLWGVMIAFIDKKPPLNAALEALLFAVIAALMIQNFTWVSESAIALAKNVMGGSTVAEQATLFVKAMFNALGSIATKVFEAISKLNFWEFFKALPALAAIVVAIVFGALSVVSLMGVALQGPFALAIGLSISPLIAATIANQYTRRWFDQWLNFMVASAFLTAMVFVAIKLLSEPLLVMVNSINTGAQNSLAGGAVQIAVMLYFSSKMLSAVPSICDAIFPGRTGAGAIATSAQEMAKAATTFAAGVAAARVATMTTAKEAIRTTGNAATNVRSAMVEGAKVASTASGSGIDRVAKGVTAGGASMASEPLAKAATAVSNVAASVAQGWKEDGDRKLGDRVASAINNTSTAIKANNISAAKIAKGSVQFATGAATAVAGTMALKVSEAVSGLAGAGTAAARAATGKTGSQTRKDMSGVPDPVVRTDLASQRDKGSSGGQNKGPSASSGPGPSQGGSPATGDSAASGNSSQIRSAMNSGSQGTTTNGQGGGTKPGSDPSSTNSGSGSSNTAAQIRSAMTSQGSSAGASSGSKSGNTTSGNASNSEKSSGEGRNDSSSKDKSEATKIRSDMQSAGSQSIGQPQEKPAPEQKDSSSQTKKGEG